MVAAISELAAKYSLAGFAVYTYYFEFVTKVTYMY